MKSGDKILVKQHNSTIKPPFDPKPYTLVRVDGNQIDAERDGTFRRRDKNSVKVLKRRPHHLVPSWEKNRRAIRPTEYQELDIEGSWPEPEREATTNETGDVRQDDHKSESIDNDFAILTEEGSPELVIVSINDPTSDIEDGSVLDDGRILATTSYSSQPCHPRALRKGDRVAFKGKEADNVEWFTCTLHSRAGRAKGMYSLAWNILRNGIIENIDLERDVGEFVVL